MAIKTTLEQLEEVQAAITAALSAEEYSISTSESRMMKRTANLEQLYIREKELLRMYAAEQNGGRGIQSARLS